MLIQSFGKGKMFESSLLSCVTEDMNHAIENGYTFNDYSDEDLAGDLMAYSDEYENSTFEDVLEAVKEWRNINV